MRLVIVSSFNAFVSEDLSASVGEWDPSADVHVSATLADAVARLQVMPAVFAVFVTGRSDRIVASGLPALVAARGGRLVWVTDSTANGETSDWIRVGIPFTGEMLREALARAEIGDGAPTAEPGEAR